MKTSPRPHLFGGLLTFVVLLLTAGIAVADPHVGFHGYPYPYPYPEPNPGDPTNPSQDPTKGWVSGTLADAAGGPLRHAWLAVTGVDNGGFYTAITDAAGRYRVSNVPVGSYLVRFQLPQTHLYQYVPSKVTPDEATAVMVAAGRRSEINDTALRTGTIAGRLSDERGRPVQSQLNLTSVEPRFSVYGGDTRADGRFSIPVFAGYSYRVQFMYHGGLQQYAYQQTDESRANAFAVHPGATVVVNETTMPTGSVGGTLLGTNGTPAANVTVNILGVGNGQSLWTGTAADGTFRFPHVLAGDYRVQFWASDSRRQWAYSTIDYARAATITVRPGQHQTVLDRLLPTGSLAVTVTDAATGSPVPDACVYVWGPGGENRACAEGARPVVVVGLPEGTGYEATISERNGRYLGGRLSDITIVGNQTTAATVPLGLAAVIEATVLDAATRAPVSGACLTPSTLPNAQVEYGGEPCADDHGKARMTLPGGTYRLFVTAGDEVHGAQWVGAAGGTGSEFLAKRIDARPGAVSAVTVLLDRRGSISGTVTDARTGEPVRYACVSIRPVIAGLGGIDSCHGGYTDAAGRYTVNGLGPYQWPVQFAHSGYAWQWSGGVGSRLRARPVTVTAGQSVSADAKLTAGTTLRGRVLAGTPPRPTPSAVLAADALTGDPVGVVGYDEDGSYELGLLPGAVRIKYRSEASPWYWYRNAKDFQHARTVVVGARPITLDLVVPAS